MIDQTLEYDFKPNEFLAILGYSNCLLALIGYLREETASNPNRRYIDALKLAEVVGNTNRKLTALLQQGERDLLTEVDKIIKE